MRWMVVTLGLVIVAGCESKTPSKTDASVANITEKSGKPETATMKARAEPEKDSEPPHFDPADGQKTLRWIISLTEQVRSPHTHPTKANELWKTVQKTMLECVKKTVKWKVPLESIAPDGKLLFSSFHSTDFPERSDAHPEISLKIRPWNSAGTESLFMCPAHPWLSTVRAGRDAVTVQGVITAINARDFYDWYISLTDIEFTPDSAAGLSPQTENPPINGFDAADADKSLAWLRQQLYRTLDPFITPGDRKKRKDELSATFRSLTRTKIRWSWPTAVVTDNAVALQDRDFNDSSQQIYVRTGLLLKQPKASAPPGRARPLNSPEYSREFYWAFAGKSIDTQVIAKIREVKKCTVTGKITKIVDNNDRVYPPHVVEIALFLDDVSVEP